MIFEYSAFPCSRPARHPLVECDHPLSARWTVVLLLAVTLVSACSKEGPKSEARPLAEVSVIKVAPRDTPVAFEYVGQTQSSHQVQIVARVNGFLEKRVYTEGSVVKAGDVMFLQDPKPLQATLDAYNGALAEQQARLQTARDDLARVKPLAARNALSKKDLDDATGREQAAAAAVDTARANVVQAKLNLGYTRITTPVTGQSSFARMQEGQYLSGQNSLLTYVEQIDPVWVNFSVSENDMLKFRTDSEAGRLRMPKSDNFVVEVVLANGALFPTKGRITFANADYNQQTGTYYLRATLPNPAGALRPGQFVRVRVSGAMRPNAILVPQQAVLQGAKGHFVFVVDAEGHAQIRVVDVGGWNGDQWFINSGLAAGETVITEGLMRLGPGAPVKVVEATAPAAVPAAPAAAPAPAKK